MSKDNSGTNKLASVIQDRMKQANESPLVLDFGTIGGDMSLKTNTFPLAIPQSDYMVCRSVALGKVDDVLYKTKENEPPPVLPTHKHDMLIGEKMRWLKPGDRVLVAWVGDDPCVIDLILPAKTIK